MILKMNLAAIAGTLLLALTPLALPAQEKETKTLEKEKPAEPTPPPPKEESSSTDHSIKIGGQTIPYKAVAQTIMLKNEKEEPQALIYSTSYFRTDSKDPARPISFIYNGGTLLDKTDMVFIDPVGTGFSHAVGKAQDKDFWGVDQDVKSLAQFITLYVSRNDRWNSPKFLIGESYGTFRSAALGNYLQEHEGMDFNGIVLIFSVLDLGTISFHPGS